MSLFNLRQIDRLQSCLKLMSGKPTTRVNASRAVLQTILANFGLVLPVVVQLIPPMLDAYKQYIVVKVTNEQLK